jgi:carotenoid 1,2-hydratase
MPLDPPSFTESSVPRFDVSVPDSGYRWWYVDGISEDGQQGIVIIAFIGSVFSPYYFRARARGESQALDFCTINVGLYRKRNKLWAMTERNRESVGQSPDQFSVGPSALRWDGRRLVIDIRERCMPFGQKLAGQVFVDPAFLNPTGFFLDPGDRHRWRPVSPIGHIDVRMQAPDCRWSGAAYLDTNWGSRPLEQDFSGWNWSRHADSNGAFTTYAADLLNGESRSLALSFDSQGNITQRDVPGELELPGTGWRVARQTRSDKPMTVHRTLEDTPFSARSILKRGGDTGTHLVMHESLSLDRFRRAWVRSLLPFRMPRVRTRVRQET